MKENKKQVEDLNHTQFETGYLILEQKNTKAIFYEIKQKMVNALFAINQ